MYVSSRNNRTHHTTIDGARLPHHSLASALQHIAKQLDTGAYNVVLTDNDNRPLFQWREGAPTFEEFISTRHYLTGEEFHKAVGTDATTYNEGFVYTANLMIESTGDPNEFYLCLDRDEYTGTLHELEKRLHEWALDSCWPQEN